MEDLVINKQKYVCGFLFNEKLDTVLLIEKNRPQYMVGKHTGIGGKIENFTKINDDFILDFPESPVEAMEREFKEEAGIEIENWKGFCDIEGQNHHIYYFYAISDDIFNAKQMEDEKLIHCPINELYNSDYLKTMPNVKWIIQMIFSMLRGEEINNYFKIKV